MVYLLHLFRVYFGLFSTRFECISASSPLVSSVVFMENFVLFQNSFNWKRRSCRRKPRLRAKTENLGLFPTRFECSFTSSPLVSSVVFIFSTRFECRYSFSPLVSSVVFIFCTRLECSFHVWGLGDVLVK